MSFVSLYRKWRSQTFDEIAGQVHFTKTIKNAVRYKRITHSYLFCGPKGTGKTSTARILARALNCEKGTCSNPCNTCEMCIQISSGSAIDVIEIDGASNRGINEIMNIIKLLTDSKQQFHPGGEDVTQIEITFLLMCHRSADRSPGVMEERLAEIEEKIKRLSEFTRL